MTLIQSLEFRAAQTIVAVNRAVAISDKATMMRSLGRRSETRLRTSPLKDSEGAPHREIMLRSLFAILYSLAVAAQAGIIDLTSPDGAVRCQISTDMEAHLLYSVTQGGQPRLEPVRAGVIIDNVDLGAKVTLGEPRTRSISEVFSWRGNKTTATKPPADGKLSVSLRPGSGCMAHLCPPKQYSGGK
jgi:hypothetical protein